MSSGHIGIALILALREAEEGGLEGQGRHGLPRGECQRSQRVGSSVGTCRSWFVGTVNSTSEGSCKGLGRCDRMQDASHGQGRPGRGEPFWATVEVPSHTLPTSSPQLRQSPQHLSVL